MGFMSLLNTFSVMKTLSKHWYVLGLRLRIPKDRSSPHLDHSTKFSPGLADLGILNVSGPLGGGLFNRILDLCTVRCDGYWTKLLGLFIHYFQVTLSIKGSNPSGIHTPEGLFN
jgi:hypothetical protein